VIQGPTVWKIPKGKWEGVNQRGTGDTDTRAKSLKDTKREIRSCKSERDPLESSSFWSLYHLSLSDLHLLITPFGILIFQTFGPCIICPSLIYTFSLLLWYLQTFGPGITCPSLIYSFWLPFWYLSNFWPLYQYHLSLSDWHLLITLLGSFKLLALVSPVPLWFTPCHYSFGIFKLLARGNQKV
jgi:hypothetical protein